MHSTSLRFLAELGLIGVTLYLCFTGYLLIGALRLFFLARKTPYQFPAWVLFVAFCALSVSQYYNRMFTDRPYWLLLAVFLGFEAFLLEKAESVPVISVVRTARVTSSTPLTSPFMRSGGSILDRSSNSPHYHH